MMPAPAGGCPTGAEPKYLSQVDALLVSTDGDLARARRSVDGPASCSGAFPEAGPTTARVGENIPLAEDGHS